MSARSVPIQAGRASVIPLLVLACLFAIEPPRAATAAQEQLAEEHRKWLEEEVVYIITDREREAFLELPSSEEREAFIEAFWRRRDPDPLTPINELREEHYRRIEYANRHLGRESAVPGWRTDRGKMYILLGEPDDRENFQGAGALYPAELWFYLADHETGLPPIYLLFFQQGHAGPYRLYNHAIDRPEDLIASPQPLDAENMRLSTYQFLQNISPELAHAAVSMRADRGGYTNVLQPEAAALDAPMILSQIYEAPYRRLDTSYLDRARDARGLVESGYLFNYVPNTAVAHVLPGPAGSSFVHYSVEIEPQHFTFVHDEKERVFYTRLIVQGEVETADGRSVLELGKDVYLRLTESEFADIRYQPFSYQDVFPLAPGTYRLRLVLKNEARREYTIFETEVEAPARSGTVHLDPPILLYAASELAAPDADAEFRAYQLGRMKLEPNARRVYSIGDELNVYVPLERPSEDTRLSLRVVGEEDPSETLASTSTRLGEQPSAPIVESLKLFGLPGGRYRLIAELLDPAGEVLAARSAPFEITPRTHVMRPWVVRESFGGARRAAVEAALAEQYMKLGDDARAREASRRALEADPSLTPPRIVLGLAFLGEGKFQDAIDVLEPAYARDQANVAVQLALGDAHYRAKNYARAAELLEATLTRRSPDTTLLNALAICHAEMGHRDKMLEYIRWSLELEPNQEAVRKLLDHVERSARPDPR